MVNLIRRFQQPLLIAITILVIISFVVLYNVNSTRTDRYGSGNVATVYGRGVSVTEYQRELKKFDLSRGLMMFDMLQSLVGDARSMEQARDNFAINSIILRREADRLSIEPTTKEVLEAIQKMPQFQTNGMFDYQKYKEFADTGLGARGMSDNQLEEIVRDRLRLEKIKDLLGATVRPTTNEIRSAYEQQNQLNHVSVIRLKLDDFKAQVKLTDEDLQKAFEERKDRLKSPEKRKVKYVEFALPKQDKPGAEADKVQEERQKLADKAGNFAVAMAEKNAKLEDVAAKFEVTVKESPEFTVDAPPAELGSSHAVAQAAFHLTKQDPNSDPILTETESGYYVLQLADVMESRPLTFEEAKPKLTEELTQERAMEAMNLKASEIRTKIETETKAGKSFAEAAEAAGVKPEQFPAFSMAKPKFDQPDAQIVMSQAQGMTVGQLSEFVPNGAGGVILHLDSRDPVDESNFEKEKTTIANRLEQNSRNAVFAEWLKQRRNEAKVQVGRA